MKKSMIKALLIEDNPGDARLIKEILSESKRTTFNLIWVDRLSKGIDFIKGNTVDVVLLDLSLPDSKGAETFERLARQVPQMPIVVLTGLDDEQLAISLLRSGLQDYIVKDSVNTDMLARAVRYAIERKRLEDEVRAAYNELEMRVRQRTLELSDANKELREEIVQREKAESELKESKAQAELYVDLMAHDINNINQIAMGYLEIALEELPLDEKNMELVARPLESLKASSKLIENVRKLQKVKSANLEQSKVDLGPILAEVVGDFSSVPGRDVNISYKPVYKCYVMADYLLIDVFSNLVGNAIKHTDDGVNINIESSQVADEDGKQFYKIVVDDNGPGIPDELKGKIFDRFNRGETKARGSGIGLYLIKSLVKKYAGKVWVEDRVHGDRNAGSRFVVMLPVAE